MNLDIRVNTYDDDEMRDFTRGDDKHIDLTKLRKYIWSFYIKFLIIFGEKEFMISNFMIYMPFFIAFQTKEIFRHTTFTNPGHNLLHTKLASDII